MALAIAIQGATRPSQSITWSRSDGDPEVLTGATITGVLQSKRTLLSRAATGTFTVTDGANGVFSWGYSAADVAEAGDFNVQFTATFSAEPTVAKTYVSEWEVKSALTVSA